MNTQNSEKLYRDFPQLYRGRDKPITESLMAFGFECGDGWFGLIHQLSADITRVVAETGVDVEVVQVKEKFGALRYYVHGGNDEIYRLIEDAERRSGGVCEMCGQPGHRRPGGWIRTLCDGCQSSK